MNKIEILLKELCPNGVEWKEVGDVTQIKKGKQLNKSLLTDDGTYPAYNGGQFESGRTDRYNVDENTTIISQGGASAGFVNFITTKFWANAHCYFLLPDKKIINNKYLYHFIKMKQNNLMESQYGSGIPALKVDSISKIKIPIPPFEIQEEIVKILDKFTDYVTELTTELTLRQKQYNYYRDKLLSFENEVQIKKLSELATIKARIGWQGLTKKEYLKTGKYYLVTGTDFIKGTVNFSTCHFVEEERYLQDINIQLKNEDVLVTKDGTLGKVAYITNLPGPTTLNSGVFVVRKNSDEILSRYLYHYLNSPYLMKFAQSRLTGGTIKHLNQNVIVDFPIPIPDLEKQKEIIYILDSFNSIVNSLEKGLPKEIELRQKQYEYYRDKLLTFD